METGFLRVVKLSVFAIVVLLMFTANSYAAYFDAPVSSPKRMHFFGSSFMIEGSPAVATIDEIGVFDADGVLVGTDFANPDGVYLLTVFGDDSLTAGVDEGAEPGEELSFKVWDASAGRLYDVTEVTQINPGVPYNLYGIPSSIPITFSSEEYVHLNIATTITASGTAGTDTGSGSTGSCFIATAAYGSYLDKDVMVLRKFRDDLLLTNGPGSAFVGFYYRYSPPIARFIQEHRVLRSATRAALAPLVYGIKYPGPAFAFFGAAALSGIFLIRRKR